jgi:hypothetical protein
MERLLKLVTRLIYLLSNAKERRILFKYVVQTLSERLFIDVFLCKLLLRGLTWPFIEFFVFNLISVFFLTQIRLEYKTNTLSEQFESYWMTFF